MKRRDTIRVLLILAIALPTACFTGCGGDDPTAPYTPPANMTEFLEQVPTWDQYSPVLPSTDEPVGEESVESIDHNGTPFECSTTEYSLTNTPDKMTIFNPDAEIMWLGSMLQGDGYRGGLGSLQELPIRQRAPLTVFLDLLTEDQSRVVPNPGPATVGSAIGDLIEQAELAGHVSGSKVFFDQKETHSLEQAAIDLGISARYLGTSVASQLDYDSTVEEHTITAYFIQQMFTASMVLPQTPAELFSAEFTNERLTEQVRLGRMGPENPPTFISSIVYGRMLMLTMTSTYSYEKMRAALQASRDGLGSLDVAAEHLAVINESSIRVSTVGGSDEGVLDLLRTGKLGSYFASDAPLTSARPLSYTVRPVADSDNIAKVSETTRYNLRECSAVPQNPTGARFRVKLDKLLLVADGCDGAVGPSPEVYYNFDLLSPAGTVNIARRDSDHYVVIKEGTEHYFGSADYVNVTVRGSQTFTIKGDAWDYDPTSGDEHIGSWSVGYSRTASNGQRYFTRSGDGCTIRLYFTLTKLETLYD